MRNLTFQWSLVLLSALAACASAAQPNIVYFLVDDMGAADCGFAGGKEINTPHIDELAADGCRLTSYYVQPLCSPTRAAFLSGRYPMRHGLQVDVVRPWATHGLPLDEKTIADDLKAAGYATGIFGKWHLGFSTPEYIPNSRGFTKQYGHYNGAINYFNHKRDGSLDWHEDGRPLVEEGYSTDLIGQHAAQFIRENAGKKPFFVYVPFNGVHSPYQPPQDGTAAYSKLSRPRQRYAAMLSAVDNAIGEVVKAVDESGARNNTLFIFSSDNGGPAPGRITDNGALRGGKRELYEGGVRVAAFATWDGQIAAGSSVDEPIHVTDWRPTLQKLCNAQSSGGPPVDGLDVWSTVKSGAPTPHTSILLNAAPKEGAVRVGDWKLIARKKQASDENATPAESIELYNLREDLSEKTNLAEKHPEKVAELKAILDGYAQQAIPPKSGPRPPSFKKPAVWGDFGA